MALVGEEGDEEGGVEVEGFCWWGAVGWGGGHVGEGRWMWVMGSRWKLWGEGGRAVADLGTCGADIG